ncbi:integrator complex subunit 12 [Xenopus tropicalis]|uniref:Integrator complex subunit 12 n=1 Tax=Xenopus tropicalis TaxID=8364 RepID=INT12_XENTR|nr:integrator complex subunit 12 [Xenopus tropicalis]Q0V9U1.1 RecName: Full=Integrator complex subunit 12; Short=Int12 [Xenopus tropicalis]AAI21397.1 integrator complex subunit 12 [Xenopus tropicalis]|eukprot:NP_001072325.1 integrator complex subunit 12 [Xenopus tropicalis]
MAVTINTELDPVFLKALGYLHSKSKDSAEKLKALLDESLCKGNDSVYRPQPKEMEQPKAMLSKVKPETKASSSTPSSSMLSKPLTSEKLKKEAEKRSADKMKVEISDVMDIPKKPRIEKTEARSSPVTVQLSKDLPVPDLSSFDETSADDFAMEMGLACVVCRQMTVFSGNQLVECQECHNLYHQDCHKPQVTDKDVNDPRLVWYCARCTRQMKRMAQKNQKPSQKPSPSAVSAVTPVAKDPSVNKPELKAKPDSANTFLAFKRAEVKASSAVSSSSSNSGVSSSSASGLTGWAAFGAKTANAVPVLGKLGTSSQATSGKPPSLSSVQKTGAAPGLAPSKPGSVSKSGSGGSSSSSTIPIKPLPPLILGKTGLSRSMSSDNVSKTGLPSPNPSSAGSVSSLSSQLGSNNGSSSAAGSNVTSSNKVAVDPSMQLSGAKGPTSQESQLNAMKRLQMVKKKAAQKKLKK